MTKQIRMTNDEGATLTAAKHPDWEVTRGFKKSYASLRTTIATVPSSFGIRH
jgi:hypothetical protein